MDALESDCSKRHSINYETCTNSTEVSQQKCTVCKVVGSHWACQTFWFKIVQPRAVIQCIPVERVACLQVRPTPLSMMMTTAHDISMCWYADMLVCWYAGMLICWYADLLIRWFADMLNTVDEMLVCWYAGMSEHSCWYPQVEVEKCQPSVTTACNWKSRQA